jgi:hypothetical protein
VQQVAEAVAAVVVPDREARWRSRVFPVVVGRMGPSAEPVELAVWLLVLEEVARRGTAKQAGMVVPVELAVPVAQSRFFGQPKR